MTIDANIYDEIMKEICNHKDFGKRNPVDIGMECGYGEDEVLKMLNYLSEKVESSENESDLQKKYYFLFSRKEKYYIVSVDIDNWSTQVVEEVKDYNYIGTLFQIKKNIFARVDFNDRKTIKWENLETKEHGEFFTNEDIKKLLVIEYGIVAATSDQMILFKYDGTSIEKDIETYADLLIEEERKIYSISRSLGYFYVFSEDLEILKEMKYDFPYDYDCIVTDYEDGKLSWYLCKEEVHILDSNSYYWKKYTEDNTESGVFYNGVVGLSGKYAKEICNDICGVRTKNYKLLQRKIYTMDEKYEICDFERKLGKKSGAGQVVGIFDKDIFIGITKSLDVNEGENMAQVLSRSDLGILGTDLHYGDAILKIDLNNERKPIILPVNISD